MFRNFIVPKLLSMNESAIQARIAELQLQLGRAMQDYDTAIVNEVEFDQLKTIRQTIKQLEESIQELRLRLAQPA